MSRLSGMIKNTNIITFKNNGGEFGNLIAIEGTSDIPFGIKRIYYITGVPKDARRGFHSHRDLEQVLICLNGSVRILVKTPFEEETITLDSTTKGLYIGNMVWREMFSFTKDAVLLVLASKHYDESDYIRDYSAYEKEAVKYFGL